MYWYDFFVHPTWLDHVYSKPWNSTQSLKLCGVLTTWCCFSIRILKQEAIGTNTADWWSPSENLRLNTRWLEITGYQGVSAYIHTSPKKNRFLGDDLSKQWTMMLHAALKVCKLWTTFCACLKQNNCLYPVMAVVITKRKPKPHLSLWQCRDTAGILSCINFYLSFRTKKILTFPNFLIWRNSSFTLTLVALGKHIPLLFSTQEPEKKAHNKNVINYKYANGV